MKQDDNLPTPFDAYEISGVREFETGPGRHCEQVDDAEAEFWSLYGHIPGEGVECIGNYKSRKAAEEIYARITGQSFCNQQPPGRVGAHFEPEIDVHQLLAKRRQVAVVWSIEDVQGVRPDLGDDQAWEVLERCRNQHDCEWGFTWKFIEDIAREMFPEPSEPKE